jgi:hypothetical protein
VLLRLPAYLASTHLTFDDGVFGASAVAMRAGGRPFADVFSSQGPLFLPLVWLGDLAGFRTASSTRVLAVVSGVVLTLAVYAIGRLVSDRGGALLAAGLTTTSISVLGVTGPLGADGAAMAATTVGVLLAIRWRDEPSVRHAILIGLAVGAGLSVKSLLAPAVVPVALVLLSWRRVAPVVAAAATAIAFNVAVSLPWGFADVWDQSYGYHLGAADDRTPLSNLGKLLSTLVDRDLPLVVASVLALGTVVGLLARGVPADERSGSRLAQPDVLFGAWALATFAVLLAEHPMWRPHIAHLVPPLALLAARHRPSWRVLGVAAVVVVPIQIVQAWHLLDPPPYRQETQQVVDALAALPPGALAISDEPGLVWRAGRRTPPELVDGSVLLIETDRVDSDLLVEVAARPDVCAVAVRSAERWGSFDDLPDRLLAEGYEAAITDPRGRVLYLKSDCRPEL